MIDTLNNFQIIEVLQQRGFVESTSDTRSTKSRRFQHRGLARHVSVKLSENPSRPTTTYPLVIEAGQWDTLKRHFDLHSGVEASDKPAKGGSVRYGEVPGVALTFRGSAALQRLLDLALGAAASAEPEIPDTPEAREAAREVDTDPTTHDADETTRTRLVNARLGQGGYRSELFRLWDGRCSLTACDVPQVLVASHAKPWAESSNAERLDGYNGLLLAASVDRLFDNGLIAFDNQGAMLLHASIGEPELKQIGLSPSARLRKLYPQNVPYLTAHRKRFGF